MIDKEKERSLTVEMILRCRAGQKAMGDDPDCPGGAPITPGPFCDDHGEMPMFLPVQPDQVPEGP